MILANQTMNNFLQDNALWIVLGFVGLIVVVLAIILASYLIKKNKKAPKINPNQNDALFEALGGKDNLIDAKLTGSRLKITIKSNEKIDQEKLKEIGIDNTIVMSNNITLILNEQTKEEFKDFKLN